MRGKRIGKPKRHVNYHTRDLSTFPFFSYHKRRQSHAVSGKETGASHQAPLTVKLSEPDENVSSLRSGFAIDSVPKLAVAPKNGHRRHANSMLPSSLTLSGGKDSMSFKSVNLGQAGQKTPNRTRVAYWAGLRVEGGLSPFGINVDDLTRWND